VVCADVEELASAEITAIAHHLHRCQTETIARAMRAVAARFEAPPGVIALGIGEFLARDAARTAGLAILEAPPELRGPAGRVAPSVALSVLGGELR
jgi:uncharacterized hydantoinase/oxoprolinase family protein